MFAFIGLPLRPPMASEFAESWEPIFWYINVVTIVAGLLVYAGIVYFCFAFQKKSAADRTPRILGSTKLEILWSVIPLFFFLSFFVWGAKVYNETTEIPSDAPEYFVVGKQWMWKIQHPDGQREINELHLPANSSIRITGTSEDVIHDFGIPAFRSKFDVVPGRYTGTWYKTNDVTGTFHIFCDQYCGMGHSQMVGKVHVLSKADYENWKAGTYKTEASRANDGSMAWEGRKLFLKLQCNACHNAESTQRAPRLEGYFGQTRPLQGGSLQKFDDEYIKQSIRKPMDKVADGWKPIMPAYPVGQVDEIELRNLVAYIKSLKAGDLPSRTDRFPAPVGAPGAPTSEGGLPK